MTIKLLSVLCVGISAIAFLPGSASDAPPAPASSTAGPLTVDMVHSSMFFRVKHMDCSYFYGRFNKFGGDLLLQDKDGSVTLEIDADSIDSNNKDRDHHLTGKDFLNTKEFPKVTFKSKTVTKKGDDWEVAGDMTMHGVTKPLTVVVKPTGSMDDPRAGKGWGFETEFTIKRTDFGVGANMGPKIIGDEIKVMLAIEAGAKK